MQKLVWLTKQPNTKQLPGFLVLLKERPSHWRWSLSSMRKSWNTASQMRSLSLSLQGLPWQEQWQMPDSNDSKDKWIRYYEFSKRRNLSKLSPCAHSLGSWFDGWSFGDQCIDDYRMTSWVIALLSWTIDDRQDFGLIERVDQLALYWNTV